MKNTETRSTRKADREIISVSLPVAIYDALMEVCDHYDINRSALIASAIADRLQDLGKKVGEY